MGRTKHKKIDEVKNLPNVFSLDIEDIGEKIAGYFANPNPITLEIGCGQGDYTFELASAHPQKNFVGVDVKGARVWVGAKNALQNNIKNAAFLLINAASLGDIFHSKIISEIFIPFPEPHVRRRSSHRRLVSPNFLAIYKSILVDNGKIHLKTDNVLLFDYALKIIEKEKLFIYMKEEDLYSNGNQYPLMTGIKTKYEKHYLEDGRKIKYICFGFD